jgi:hypothetical protein
MQSGGIFISPFSSHIISPWSSLVRLRPSAQNKIWGIGAHREERESAQESAVYEVSHGMDT